MSYPKNHTDAHCDRCGEWKGRHNLYKLPFLYMDKNDKKHPDVSQECGLSEPGYRQYYVCVECFPKNIER